ncbi:MAG: manganese efflux pump [Collinsella sp.]|nr:manganese efflux pump [Collinsella sp.]
MLLNTADSIESAFLGVALAMDAMAVTLSNALAEPHMPKAKKIAMPLSFAIFQMGMPVLGYFGGTLVASYINAYAGIVSFVILAIVGGKMIWEALQEMRSPGEAAPPHLTWRELFFESIATSIDAFIVGVSFAATGKSIALYGSMIGITTFACCLAVLVLGKKLGEHFGVHAQLAGGAVLICIGFKALLP